MELLAPVNLLVDELKAFCGKLKRFVLISLVLNVLYNTPYNTSKGCKSFVEDDPSVDRRNIDWKTESSCFKWQATTKPVAVGFGISKPEHVKQVRLSEMPIPTC